MCWNTIHSVFLLGVQGFDMPDCGSIQTVVPVLMGLPTVRPQQIYIYHLSCDPTPLITTIDMTLGV